MPGIPVVTLLLCGAVVAIHLLAGWQAWLVFDRVAIETGEWWRLATGNLVHYSPPHLLVNIAAFVVAGTLIEARRLPYFAVLCLVAGIVIGLSVYVAEPGLRHFAGLSGIATAAVVYLCLFGLGDGGWWRWLCVAVLAGVALKLGAELVFGFSLLSAAGPVPFRPVPTSHAAGALMAVVMFGLAAVMPPSQAASRDPGRVG